MIRKLTLFFALLGAFPAPVLAQDEMTRAAFELYLERFSAGDERYAELYDPDVVFEHAPQFGVLRGREAILEFYRGIREQLEETVVASEVVIDNEQGVMAAELTTQLLATRDGVEMPSGTLDAGDMIISRGTVYYRINNGRITHIRGGIQGAERIAGGQ
ncbi:nuclear transport factor 2 family protein [Altericroceibacterium endophyticum]|uniref:SnoaL-like domain-containing protein n=1 Tax=Altericroceibacterium endophyticum TaxID=1808508 RepID=A0A6I4TA00_9SPHN|nr:nuclear transport factor 2 family protein [Altericroceibacterium endophyticum]MXO67189.1 hypothetical protein [Altericroceibacterium endophyticum]